MTKALTVRVKAMDERITRLASEIRKIRSWFQAYLEDTQISALEKEEE